MSFVMNIDGTEFVEVQYKNPYLNDSSKMLYC